MIRLATLSAPVLLLCSASPVRQADEVRALIRPTTGNVRERAVRLDAHTGQVQRLPASTVDGLAMLVIYDNTCPTGYFVGLSTTSQNGPGSTGPMALGDWGALPSTIFGGSAGCTPGELDTYDIAQFTIGYCTGSGLAVDMVLHFWDRAATGSGLDSCNGVQLVGGTVPPAVPTAVSLTITGLPRSSAVTPAAVCYAVQVTLGTPGFSLNGGAYSLTDLDTFGDRFSWSMQVTNGTGNEGPILAGNALLMSPCTFCAGTVWEVGGQTATPGIGLGQDNHVWLDTYNGTTPVTDNCFSFGGNPWAGVWLTVASEDWHAGQPAFCDVSDGSLASCPCGNPGAPEAGCDNAQSTGGVRLEVIAYATSPSNAATLQGTGFPTMGAPTAIVLRSNALDPNSPIVLGDGLRCVNTSPLARLAATVATGGVSTHAIGHGAGPGTFFYQIWYRNTPSTFCDAFAAFNLSSGQRLPW